MYYLITITVHRSSGGYLTDGFIIFGPSVQTLYAAAIFAVCTATLGQTVAGENED